jgi:hypothetical protein
VGGPGVVVFLIFPFALFQSTPLTFISPFSNRDCPSPSLPLSCLRRKRERGGERERREKLFRLLFPDRDVILEVVDRGGVTVGGSRSERIAAVEGGDALEGSLVEHEEPHPDPGEIVSFLMFHECGLGHPVHLFLLSLLNEWVVEL